MATGSDLQHNIFTGETYANFRPDLEFKIPGLNETQWISRRANKPQKCFVSGETESVANTSAFVGPVASIFDSVVLRAGPALDGLRAAGFEAERFAF